MKYDKALVAQLISGDGDPAVQQWLHGGGGDPASWDAELAAAAIEAAVQMRRPEPLQGLESAPKELRKAGRKGLHRLRSQGIEVDGPPASTTFSLGKEQIRIDPLAFVSPADPDGYSQFVLAWTDEEGTCVVMGNFGGPLGLREVQHGHIGRAKLRDMSRELPEEGLNLVPFSEALGHILPSLDLATELTGVPHAWEHFASHIPEGVFQAARVLDPLRGAADEEPDLAGSAALANHPWFAFYPVSTAAMNNVVERMAASMEAENPIGDDMQVWLSEAAAEALEEEQRVEWARRARIAASANRQDPHLFKMAANLVRALESGQPASAIPLVEASLQFQIGYAMLHGGDQ